MARELTVKQVQLPLEQMQRLDRLMATEGKGLSTLLISLQRGAAAVPAALSVAAAFVLDGYLTTTIAQTTNNVVFEAGIAVACGTAATILLLHLKEQLKIRKLEIDYVASA